MKKSILAFRLSKNDSTSLPEFLLKRWWVILATAVVSVLITALAVCLSKPDQYTESVTLALYDQVTVDRWSSQHASSSNSTAILADLINEGTVGTDFVSEDRDGLERVTVSAVALQTVEKDDKEAHGSGNLMIVRATADTHEAVCRYLTALADNAQQLTASAGLTSVAISTVDLPDESAPDPDRSNLLQWSVTSALIGAALSCAVLIAIDLYMSYHVRVRLEAWLNKLIKKIRRLISRQKKRKDDTVENGENLASIPQIAGMDESGSQWLTDRTEEKAIEIDLRRWVVTTLKAMGRIKFKWMIAFGISTVAAVALGLVLSHMAYQTDTVFTVKTADRSIGLSADEFDALSDEELASLMSDGASGCVHAKVLCPTERATDVDQLMKAMPPVWSSQAMADAIGEELGDSVRHMSIKVLPDARAQTFTLSVNGSDKELTQEVTEAFFEIAPSISAYSAGGLTFDFDDSVTVAAGTGILSVLPSVWLLVILVGVIYALTLGYVDRALYFDCEAADATGLPALGRTIPLRHFKKADSKNGLIDARLTSALGKWVCKEKRLRILVVASSLREESTAQLTQTAVMLLKRNGKHVLIADDAVRARLLEENGDGCDDLMNSLGSKLDVLLVEAPGMAVDDDACLLAENADAVIWAIREGYADSEQVVKGVERLKNKEKVLGCVLTAE